MLQPVEMSDIYGHIMFAGAGLLLIILCIIIICCATRKKGGSDSDSRCTLSRVCVRLLYCVPVRC